MTAIATLHDAARSVPAAFAIGGALPKRIERPESREALSELLRGAARDGLAIVPWGGGVSLPRERAPERYDLAIDTTGRDRVVEYEPEDFTLTAEAGGTIASLRARLAARGQELPLEAPFAARATLGGVLATTARGPRRLRFGAPRDRILGARYALADGTLVRTGGKVVKNVAGYGIHRLLCGSRGALAILVEASLKLAPAPATRAALLFALDPPALGTPSDWAWLPRLEPAFVTLLDRETAGTIEPLGRSAGALALVIGLEDDAPWVARQAEAIAARLGAPSARLEGDDAAALVQRLADLGDGDRPALELTGAANTPAAIAPLLAAEPRAPFVLHASCGRLHLFPADNAAQAAVEAAAEHGFGLIAARGLEATPALDPMAATLRLRARIREALDPAKALALGDRWESAAL